MSEEIDNLVLSTVSEMIASGVGNPRIVQRIWKERERAVQTLLAIAESDGSTLGLKRVAEKALIELGELNTST